MKKRHTPTARMAAAAGALSAVVGFSLVAASGASFAGDSPSASQYQYRGKVVICHHTGSKSRPLVTLSINARALPAHQAHGDTVGPCLAATTSKGQDKGQGGHDASVHAPKPDQAVGGKPDGKSGGKSRGGHDGQSAGGHGGK